MLEIPKRDGGNSSNMMVLTSSMFQMERHLILKEEEIKKETQSSCGTDTTVQTKDGESYILMKKMMSQQLVLIKTVVCIETDHSI
jgi:hypothetical protein